MNLLISKQNVNFITSFIAFCFSVCYTLVIESNGGFSMKINAYARFTGFSQNGRSLAFACA